MSSVAAVLLNAKNKALSAKRRPAQSLMRARIRLCPTCEPGSGMVHSPTPVSECDVVGIV